ncbi:stage II sporulation protein P [Metabacillus litoralis]|uniref:stage II sporulation protein P n=1 Tax=Metabacillus litoralis TaxID=152268 RepID=UPI001CFCE07B|nr:stage II sporulation protein P [Metabacillus litoralis]
MQNEKEIFDMIKNTYPQNPSKDFIVSTENKLRQKARSMKRKSMVKRLSAISSGVLLFVFAFSWIFFFSGKDIITKVLNNVGDQSLSSAVEEQDPLVFIYHSHNNESFIPELNVTDPNKAFNDTKNITLVGKELGKALKENNINTIIDDTDITGILKERNLSFADSYLVSREKLQKTLNEHKSIKMVFDIHRDSQKKSVTTINIDGKDYARVVFVVSKTSDNYEENRDFAILLHEKLEELYPELSRGVFEKGENPQNTYNQDLQENSVLLEIGGVENTLKESYRTADAIAEAIKEVIENKEE